MIGQPSSFIPRALGVIIILSLLFLGQGYWNATRAPLVRTAQLAIADWPADTPPLRLVLISDVHVAGPDMPPSRLTTIVAQINALEPDLVLIAGDLVSEKMLATHVYNTPEIVAPYAALKARLGVVAVLGNHDHWFDASGFRSQLPRVGVTLLENQTIQRGPLVIGGVDDDYSRHADIAKTYAAMDALTGPRIILTHSPDIVPDLPRPVAAVFAGHTHCGQARFPLLGQPVKVSRYGARFNCGLIDDKGQKVIVGAGLGTSGLWARYGAPPDLWLITLGRS